MRGKLFFIPGIAWHITQRCHNQDFLLKFNKDRKRWLHWLFQAKLKYGLNILNYAVTSNHIHLLVLADGRRTTIPRSIQLIASRTAIEFNLRKNRSGAFWDDNYHATAVENDHHLLQCMVYIDLNMVRARAVGHPSEWAFCGYRELMKNPQRYRLINIGTVRELLGIEDLTTFQKFYSECVKSTLRSDQMKRDSRWTESIAVGSKAFISKVSNQLGYKTKYRNIKKIQKSWIIKDGFS
jgi:putative transposase